MQRTFCVTHRNVRTRGCEMLKGTEKFNMVDVCHIKAVQPFVRRRLFAV